MKEAAGDQGIATRWRSYGRQHLLERTRAAQLRALIILLGGAAVYPATLLEHFDVARVVITFLVLGLTFSLSVLLHELGHAVAAHLAGLSPCALLSGAGPRLLSRRIAGVAVDIGWLPGPGLTIVGSLTKSAMRWRLFAMFAGGPLVTSALLLLGLAERDSLGLQLGSSTMLLSPAMALTLVNGFLLLTVMVPLPARSDFPGFRADIPRIIGLPWMKAGDLCAFEHVARTAELWRSTVLRDYDAACEEALRLVDRDGDDLHSRFWLAEMLLFSRRYADAAEHYRELLVHPKFTAAFSVPLVRAIAANNYAWALYVLGRTGDLDTMDRLSGEALAAAPDHPSLLGTRGAILVERGNFAEASGLLKRALRRHRAPEPRACNLACLALVAHRQCQPKRAKQLFDECLKLDRECPLRERVARELSTLAPTPRAL